MVGSHLLAKADLSSSSFFQIGIISACCSHVGDDFKCPAGSLGYQAAHLTIPGTVTWDPGCCLFEQELGGLH